MDITEQINGLLGPKETTESDEVMFQKMAQFIMELEPDQLSDDELDEVVDIIDSLELDSGIEEVTSRRSKRTSQQKRQYAKRYYRANRGKIKRRKKKFKRSAIGRQRLKKKIRMGKVGKTATGRRKVRYHR